MLLCMCNVLESCENYNKATGSLWNCYGDEPSYDFLYSNSESFKYKAGITGNIYNRDVGVANYNVN